MDLLSLVSLLNVVLMVSIPVGLGIYLARRLHLNGSIWWIGAATFTLSQVVHIPFNQYFLGPWLKTTIFSTITQPERLIVNALAFGLSAGIFEGFARYLTYQFWAKDARSWGKGLLLGAGHGGIEAILLGLLVLWAYFQMVALRGADLSQYVPLEKLSLAQQQMNAYWSAAWYDSLLGFVERVFTIPFQLSASLLVLQMFIRRQAIWLGLAIAWHTLVDAGVVYLAASHGVYITEAFVGLIGLISLGIVFALRQPEPQLSDKVESFAPSLLQLSDLPPVEDTLADLEKTRYNEPPAQE